MTKSARKRKRDGKRLAGQRSRSSTTAAPKAGETFERMATIRAEDLDEDARTIEVSFSSELPVRDFYEPVILLHEKGSADLATLRDMGAVLFNHNADRIVGRPENVRLDEDDHRGRATIRFDEDDASQEVMAKVKSGSLRGVSVRYSAEKAQRINEGEEWESPGKRKFKGPLVVATRWTAREISLTPIPADVSVGVGRHETQEPTSGQEDDGMDERTRNYLISRGLANDATEDQAWALFDVLAQNDADTARELAAAKAANVAGQCVTATVTAPVTATATADDPMERVGALRSLAQESGHPELLADWLENETPVDEARSAAFKLLRDDSPPIGSPRSSGVAVVEDEWTKRRGYAEAGLCQRLGLAQDKNYKGDVPAYIRLEDIARWCLAKDGERNIEMLTPDAIAVRAISQSTSSFPLILEAAANKSIRKGYDEAPQTYEVLTRRKDVADFKINKITNISDPGLFNETPELVPVQEEVYTEEGDSFSIATYAKGYSLSRQAIVNDDLDAFSRMGRFGGSFRRTINNAVFALIQTPPTMPDGKGLFATDHPSGSNSTTGVLSATSMGVARTMMERQKGLGATPAQLSIKPRYLLIPPELNLVAQQLLGSLYNPATLATAQLPVNMALEIISESELSSTAKWYISADPNVIDTIQVARLAGQNEPVIVREENNRVLGVSWISYGDFGVKAIDHRGLVYSTGA
jgi:HK97 family phage prohead protease